MFLHECEIREREDLTNLNQLGYFTLVVITVKLCGYVTTDGGGASSINLVMQKKTPGNTFDLHVN